MPQLKIVIADYSLQVVTDRARRLASHHDTPLVGHESAVHFLRAASSLSCHALQSFYLFLGALAQQEAAAHYPLGVLANAIKFSSSTTLSLCCRKLFDHSAKGMTGVKFANSSPATIEKVAEYWANKSGRRRTDVDGALAFLQRLFASCSLQPNELFRQSTLLQRRVGFVKNHANRAAAHATLDYYEVDLADYAHVVAAMTLIGALIHGFDDPHTRSDYFDLLDKAAWAASGQVFPALKGRRLFTGFKTAELASSAWQQGSDGLDMVLDHLAAALGWWRSSEPT